YERLSGTPGPSDKVRVWAEKLGWAPPLAWEGLNIDDPNAQPQGVLRPVRPDELAWLREQKRVPAAVLVDLGDRMFALMAAETGVEPTWAEVAGRLGVPALTLEKARYRVARAVRRNVAWHGRTLTAILSHVSRRVRGDRNDQLRDRDVRRVPHLRVGDQPGPDRGGGQAARLLRALPPRAGRPHRDGRPHQVISPPAVEPRLASAAGDNQGP